MALAIARVLAAGVGHALDDETPSQSRHIHLDPVDLAQATRAQVFRMGRSDRIPKLSRIERHRLAADPVQPVAPGLASIAR